MCVCVCVCVCIIPRNNSIPTYIQIHTLHNYMHNSILPYKNTHTYSISID